MAGETRVTVTGSLTADPQLRLTAAGMRMTVFTIASTPRALDRDRGERADEEPLLLRCTLWGRTAENAAASLGCGMRVIITGKLHQRVLDDPQGRRRTVLEVDAEDIAPCLRRASAAVTRTPRTSRSGRTPRATPTPGTSHTDSGPAPPSGSHPH